MEKMLMDMAKTDAFSAQDIQEALRDTKTGSVESDDMHSKPSNVSPVPTVATCASSTQVAPGKSPENLRGCSQSGEEGEGKYAYMGSSSGVYMLHRLFPAVNRGEDVGRPLPSNEDDAMVTIFRSEKSDTSSFCCGKASDEPWVLPPKEVIDRLLQL